MKQVYKIILQHLITELIKTFILIPLEIDLSILEETKTIIGIIKNKLLS